MHKKKTQPLSPSEKLLLEIVYGSRIERKANRPFAPQYSYIEVKREHGETTERSSAITEGRVLPLVNKGLIRGEPKDALWDHVVFRATEAGEAYCAKLMEQDEPRGVR